MKNNYSEIKSLLAELDYYESKGLYKLADSISAKIKKVAKQYNPDTDTFQGMGDFLKNQRIQDLCEIPECQEFFCGGGSGEFNMTPEAGDFLDKEYKKNPNANYVDLMLKYNTTYSGQAIELPNLTPDKANKLATCSKKIGLQSSSAVAVGATASQNASTAKQATPAREPMPPM